MSRGLGRLQRTLFEIIQRHGKPMTFEDIRAVIRKELEVEDGPSCTHPWSGHYGTHCTGWSAAVG
jgi:hypothetical protein